MKFTFVEKKVNLPKSLHAYAEKKVGKLERYFKTDSEANLVFSVEKDRNKVELTIRSGSTILRVSESTSDMFASVDACVSTIERQIRKNKTRLAKRIKQEAFVRDMESISSFVPDEPEEEFQIMRVKRFNMKLMTREEAILQMNLLEHSFFAFRDEEADGAFAVVYKRNDGGYGLIQDAD